MVPLEDRIKQHARTLGFDLVGIAPATPADSFDRLRDWLDHGFAGEMGYMERHREARRDPSSILADVRSVVMLAMNYFVRGPSSVVRRKDHQRTTDHGLETSVQIARYSRGADYHNVLWEKLNDLLGWIQQEVPGCKGRGVVDTAPLLERDFARRAGLGWFGKNTMLLNKRQGSYFFLGALLVDLELTPDPPHTASHCGTCTACLDACPTAAFVGPGVLDS